MKHLILCAIALFLFSCNSKNFGTNTGNPEVPAPVSSQPDAPNYALSLVTELCNKVSQCVGPINTVTCKTQLFYSSRMTSELGPNASRFPSAADLVAAEAAGHISPVPIKFDSCVSAFHQLSCEDPLMLQSYSVDTPTDFSFVYLLLRASAMCTKIY